jgi:hypothetical protein
MEMKSNSKRAEEILKSPQFLKEKLITDEGIITTEPSLMHGVYKNEKLNLNWDNVNSSLLEQVISEGICRLLNDKSIERLFNLTTREVENFLKDDNSQGVFEDEKEGLELIDEHLFCLKVGVLTQQNKKIEWSSNDFNHGIGPQLRIVEDFFKELINPVMASRFGLTEVQWIKDKTVYVKLEPSPDFSLLNLWEKCLDILWDKNFPREKLKFVAVS